MTTRKKLSHLLPRGHHRHRHATTIDGVSSAVNQKNFKQRLIALIRKFRTDGNDFVSEEQYREALERELMKATAERGPRAIEELLDRDIDDEDDEFGSEPEDWDNISPETSNNNRGKVEKDKEKDKDNENLPSAGGSNANNSTSTATTSPSTTTATTTNTTKPSKRHAHRPISQLPMTTRKKLSHLLPRGHHRHRHATTIDGVSSAVNQKNFKQRLIALIRKFRTDGNDFVSEEQYREALERELMKATAERGPRAIEELLDRDIDDDDDEEFGSEPEDWDNISETSAPKPSLRPFFSSTTLDKI